MKDNKFFDHKFSDKVVRRDYSKTKNSLDMPNLLEIQKNSFKTFMDTELESLIKASFPINSPKGKYTLNFKKMTFGDIRSSIPRCKYESSTYDVPLYVDLELVNNETGEVKQTKKTAAKKGQKPTEGIFFGNIPLMCDKGTFIINGIEKFVITQILRSPGMYVLFKSQIKLNNNRKKTIENGVCEILPYKGTMMVINHTDQKGIGFYLRSLNSESAPFVRATTFLKAYGLSNQNILDIYGKDNEFVVDTLEHDEYNTNRILDDLDIKNITSEIEKEYQQGYSLEDIVHKGNPIDLKLRRLITEALVLNEKLSSNPEDKELLKKKEALLWKIITEKAAKDICLDLGFSPKSLDISIEEEHFCYQGLFMLYLFTERFYDLSSAGRYKIDRKLRLSERLYNNVLAEDIKDSKGNVIAEKGSLLTKTTTELIKQHSKDSNISTIKEVKIENPFMSFKTPQPNVSKSVVFERAHLYYGDETKTMTIIGSRNTVGTTLNIVDILASISYAYNLSKEIGSFDDIDHLGNKRLKLLHEQLKNKLSAAMVKIEKSIIEKLSIADGDINISKASKDEEVLALTTKELTIKSIVNTKQFQITLKDFFNSYQLIQFIDQQNPLSELTNKRRISAMGPGGISREDPNLDIRDVHNSHYGRICPIETPEGMNIGLIMSLASYARVDDNGFIETPYRKVKDKKVTDEIVWFTSLQDDEYVIAEANIALDDKNNIIEDNVVCRFKGTTQLFKPEEIDFIDVVPKQVVSVAASLIPFLENDDANRALMGSNMQRQAVPLINPKAPWVGTGSEYKIAHDSGTAIISEIDGKVKQVDGYKVVVEGKDGTDKEYELIKYNKSNQNTCNNQSPIVLLNQEVKKGDFLANGPAMENGELSLGRNVLVGFSTWNGYNFEDAIILSERLVNEDVYTSIHIDEYKIQCLQTKNGDEEISRDIPNVSDAAKKYLNEDGIIMIGAEVKEGDVLVGKVTPRGQVDLPPEEKLLYTIFGEKTKSLKDSSLKVPHGGEGIVIDVQRLKNSDTLDSDLGDDVIEVVKVYIAQKRKIQVGDKMAGRHGNKGIVSKIVPLSDMPFLDDGTPLDVMLNPLGVPSRMNIGQILELHLGLSTLELGKKELLRLVYEKKPISEIQSRYGLHEHIAINLQKHIKQLIDETKASSFDELVKTVKNNDLIIALNRVGMKFDDIGYKVSTPVFEGVQNNELIDIMNEAGINPLETHGKFKLRDGRTGDYFDGDIAVGVMYMLKLDHMVDDKIHARSIGPYSKITQQPLGGKSQNGGQRFGEMEVWALEAYGAAYNLHEILTIKSDDVRGRNMTYNAIVKGYDLPDGTTPESFKLLTKKIQGLGLYLEVKQPDGTMVDMNNYIKNESDAINNELEAMENSSSSMDREDASDEAYEI